MIIKENGRVTHKLQISPEAYPGQPEEEREHLVTHANGMTERYTPRPQPGLEPPKGWEHATPPDPAA